LANSATRHFALSREWVFILVLTAATVMSFVHRYLPAVLVDAIRRDFALSDVAFSTVQSAFALTYAAATLTSGWFSDRANRRNIIAGGIATWTLGTIIFAFADGLPSLLAGRVIVGLGEAVLVPAGVSLLCDLVPVERRGRAIALTYFGATLGTSLAFSGGGWMLSYAQSGGFASFPGLGGLSDWRRVVMLLALAGALLIPVMFAFSEPARKTNQATGKARLADLWKLRGRLWLVLFAGSSIAMADFAYTSWQTALLTREYGFDVANAGQTLGLTALLTGTAAAWLGGWLCDRVHLTHGGVGRIRLLRLCAGGLVIPTLLLLVPNSLAAVSAYALWQVVANIAYVAVAVVLQDLVTDQTRALAASLSVCLSVGVGMAFGPSGVAAINTMLSNNGDALGLSLFLFVAMSGMLTLILAMILSRKAHTSFSDNEKLA
jgi:predicted MFS family arabinose efflux permease